MSAIQGSSAPIRIVIPVYDDRESLRILLTKLDQELARASLRASVFVADDGSPVSFPTFDRAYAAIDEIRILNLMRNVGHQRAIAIGAAYVQEHLPSEVVVIMDGDGEDDPADVPRLVSECRKAGLPRIVFARRMHRSEGALFTLFSRAFRVLYRVMTSACGC